MTMPRKTGLFAALAPSAGSLLARGYPLPTPSYNNGVGGFVQTAASLDTMTRKPK
ncbi:hypothetical protein [Massilia glaciei]|uniref:hypothetical protein n=1 Tax=Massilia glaciei TaxID=1524097 RepID=UPI0015E8038E|nr:hypothetical protein [Massilia glaciei]